MLTPQTETDLVEIVRAAAADDRKLDIEGNGTKRAIGGQTAGDTLGVSALSGITAYNPAEMVMTARAGTPLSEVEAAAAAHRQHLAFEPPDYRRLLKSEGEQTIGGLFAGNLSGPRRFQSGAARDHLLGVRFVNGRGEVVQAGGRVMKNVTGLDIVKLMAGSWGTLGIMSELTFKVLPMPETSASLVFSGLDDENGARLMAAALAIPAEVSGAAYLPESCRASFLEGRLPEGGATVLRLEGLAFSVRERLQKIEDMFGKAAACTRLEEAESRALWLEIRDVAPFAADSRDRTVWKVSVPPMSGHQLLSGLRMQTGLNGYYDWQGGLIWLRMEGPAEAQTIRDGIRHLGGGHATLIRATEFERRVIPVFEPESETMAALSRRIRQKFDPSGLFNRGRMGA